MTTAATCGHRPAKRCVATQIAVTGRAREDGEPTLAMLAPALMLSLLLGATVSGMSALRLALAATCVVAAACTSHREEPRALVGDMPGAAELRCDESDRNQPTEGQRLAEGVVLASTYTPEESRREDGLLFAKGGLWVQGETALRLTVVSPSDALVSWGKPGRPVRQVVVPPCGGSKWRVWPGGFYVYGPSKVALSVETFQKKVAVTVTVGAPGSGWTTVGTAPRSHG